MPTRNKEKNLYEEEPVTNMSAHELLQREERFRTALLNELSWLSDAVYALDSK